MSSYQRKYWFPRVAELQHGEYCKGCGKTSNLVVDKINNDGNHNITDNKVKDFQLLCRHCNLIKNPVGFELDNRDKTQSEYTNRRAEKPLMEWLFKLLKEDSKEISWNYFVSEGSFTFDISPETIERRYYKKYFQAPSAPFELYNGVNDKSYIRFKIHKTQIDIDPQTPTPLLNDKMRLDVHE